jgi:acetyl esterase/lipase
MHFFLLLLAIQLWPHGAPGERGDLGPEKDTTTAKDPLVGGRGLIRLGNVTTPEITLYRPVKEKDTGAAIIVFPGGGYSILAMDLEGSEVCEWLQSIGLTGVLLKYRVPARTGQPKWAAPLQDAQRAVGTVRYHAAEWGIDAKRIGVLGFSAGGHLAAAVSTNVESRTYPPVDEADKLSGRPDFALLIYPAYLMQGDKTSPELKITSDTPPTFLVQTEDDGVHVENSLGYYAALKQAKVPVEMHLYASGGHGYGLRPTAMTVTTWPARAEEWLRSIGVMTKQ